MVFMRAIVQLLLDMLCITESEQRRRRCRVRVEDITIKAWTWHWAILHYTAMPGLLAASGIAVNMWNSLWRFDELKSVSNIPWFKIGSRHTWTSILQSRVTYYELLLKSSILYQSKLFSQNLNIIHRYIHCYKLLKLVSPYYKWTSN